MSPLDEAENGLFYLDQVFFDRVPRSLEKLERELNQFYGRRSEGPGGAARSVPGWAATAMPILMSPMTSRGEVAERSRQLALRKYAEAVDDLVGRCSLSADLAPPPAALIASLKSDAKAFPRHARTLEGRFLHEPYRRKLSFYEAQARAHARPDAKDIAMPAVSSDDAELVQRGAFWHAKSALADDLDFLCRQIRSFGFHLVSLDIRDQRPSDSRGLQAQKSGTGTPDTREVLEDDPRHPDGFRTRSIPKARPPMCSA